MMDAALPDPEYNQRWGAAARPLNARRVDPVVRRSLLVLAGAVALVLMIACANVANLLPGTGRAPGARDCRAAGDRREPAATRAAAHD